MSTEGISTSLLEYKCHDQGTVSTVRGLDPLIIEVL